MTKKRCSLGCRGTKKNASLKSNTRKATSTPRLRALGEIFASSDKPLGFGLGLRVSRELVELHGGTIEVSDSDLGGALFRVVFPVGS